jgi:DNA-binding MarR family transcriptional regulator
MENFMTQFKAGESRDQMVFFPEAINDYISEGHLSKFVFSIVSNPNRDTSFLFQEIIIIIFFLIIVFRIYTLVRMKKIKQKFNSVLKLAQQMEAEPRKYGTDTMLTGVEIHLIELIGDNENSSVTDVAKLFEVTKGAVSQRFKKLEHKELIKKNADPANASRTVVTLTSKGKVAYFAHKHWHETMDGGYTEYWKTLGPEKVIIIEEFLTKVEDFFQRMLAKE